MINEMLVDEYIYIRPWLLWEYKIWQKQKTLSEKARMETNQVCIHDNSKESADTN
jgi:hypothetical protein